MSVGCVFLAGLGGSDDVYFLSESCFQEILELDLSENP